MNTYLVFLKNPKIWFGIILFIGIIVSIILIIKALKPTPLPETKLCRGDQTKTTCPDGSIQCADKCIPAQKWDCKTQSCICPTGTTLCDKKSACCPFCSTDDMCCLETMVGKDAGGDKICCAPGTEPNEDGDKVGCVSVCGIGDSQKQCNQGELCNQINGLTSNDINNMKTHAQADSTYRGDDGATIYLCNKPSVCQWDTSIDDTALPYRDDSGPVTYYNASNIFYSVDDTDKSNMDNICVPSDPNNYGIATNECFHKNSGDCKKLGSSCIWKSALDILSETDGYEKLNKIMNSITNINGESKFGYYCGDKQHQWLQYFRKTATGCGYQDCNDALIEPGVIKINWDQTNGICTSLKSTPDAGGIVGGIQCTDVGDPCASCNEENIGEFVDCVKCYNNGPCKECYGVADGTYVPKGKCNLYEDIWSFKECNHNMNNTQDVFHYKAEGSDCTSTNCGNCPFGDNGSILRDGNNEDHGKAKSDTYNIACYTDGQIKPIQPLPEKPRFKLIYLSNGTVCHQCDPKNEEEWKTCVEQDCRQTAGCNPPYVYGLNNDICIYPCQKDGEDAKTKTDNSNDDFRFNFVAGDGRDFCFRKLPTFNGEWQVCDDWCQNHRGDGTEHGNFGNIGGEKEFAREWPSYTLSPQCYSFDNHYDCYRGIMYNGPTPQASDPELPAYMYPKDVDWKPPNVVEGQVMQCWTQTPSTNPVSLPQSHWNSGSLHHPNPEYTPDHFCPGETIAKRVASASQATAE